MIVVSDTSAISNLLAIDRIDLLHAVFGEVTIVPAVRRELHRINSHKEFLNDHKWIKVMAPSNKELVIKFLDLLDLGEAESIALAVEHSASFLIIDELKGRKVADQLGIRVVGIIGILVKAKLLGEIPLVRPYIDALKVNGFRLKESLIQQVLERVGEN